MTEENTHDISASSKAVSRYVYILIVIIVGLFVTAVVVIEKQLNVYAVKTQDNNEFHMKGINFSGKIRHAVDRAHAVILADPEVVRRYYGIAAGRYQDQHKALQNISVELQDFGKSHLDLHNKHQDPDFDLLISRLRELLVDKEVSGFLQEYAKGNAGHLFEHFRSIYIVAHQIERLHYRRLDEYSANGQKWFERFSPASLLTIAAIAVVAIVISLFIIKQIRYINREQVSLMRELTVHRGNLQALVAERSRDLESAQADLIRKERLATLGQLTATVSHELRNPLGAIRASLPVVDRLAGKYGESKMTSALQRIHRGVERCDRIIDELLDHTRMSKLDRHEEHLDNWLEGLIGEELADIEIELVWEPGLDDYVANVDFSRFRRAVINVAENACHAMLKPGSKNEYIPEARLTIRSFMGSGRANIQISDNGAGIADDVLPKVFMPLFSTKGFGVGLGMAAVEQIMHQHGGGIDLKSQEGKGTTVTLWLPVDA